MNAQPNGNCKKTLLSQVSHMMMMIMMMVVVIMMMMMMMVIFIVASIMDHKRNKNIR